MWCPQLQGWENFTDAIISAVNKEGNNVVFILWGTSGVACAACLCCVTRLHLRGCQRDNPQCTGDVQTICMINISYTIVYGPCRWAVHHKLLCSSPYSKMVPFIVLEIQV